MSKLSGDTLREGIANILAASQEKQRKFQETIELQVGSIGPSDNLCYRSGEESFQSEALGRSVFVTNCLPCVSAEWC